jgi:hypothetical protein
VLRRFREFFSAAVSKSIEVANPFIWKTKADVIRSIVERGCGPLIKDTVSCTRSYDITRLHTHCGCCSQCLDRRFAVLAAGAAEHDPIDMYKVELLTGERRTPKDQTMAESYTRTALELRDLDELAFFGRFSGETARVCSGFPAVKTDEIARQVLELHQRHGQAISDVLKAAIENHSAKLLTRSLPRSSVLVMTVVPGATPAISRGRRHPDPFEPFIEVETEEASGDGARMALATAGHETKAIKALASHLKTNTNLTRAAAAEWCGKAGYKLGKRAFERVWPQARENAGLGRIGSPGRKRKSMP